MTKTQGSFNEKEISKEFDSDMRPSFHNNWVEWKMTEHSIGH